MMGNLNVVGKCDGGCGSVNKNRGILPRIGVSAAY
jgi:hypothetical protein